MNKRKQEQAERDSHGRKGRARIKARKGGRHVIPPSHEYVELLDLMKPRFKQASKAQLAYLTPEVRKAIGINDSDIYRPIPKPAPTGARERARRLRQREAANA